MDRADAALVVPSSATAAQDLILIVAAQYIEQSLMRLEFSARGKLMRAFIHPVSLRTRSAIWPETRERTDASDQLREPDARHHPRPCRACSSARPLVPRTPPFTVVHRRLAAFWRVARNEPASADLRKYCAPSRSPHCHEAGMPIAEGFTCRSLRPVPSLSNPYSDQTWETVRDWTWKLSRGVHRRSSKSASPVSIAIGVDEQCTGCHIFRPLPRDWDRRMMARPGMLRRPAHAARTEADNISSPRSSHSVD
jgi:hypothetical protein